MKIIHIKKKNPKYDFLILEKHPPPPPPHTHTLPVYYFYYQNFGNSIKMSRKREMIFFLFLTNPLTEKNSILKMLEKIT